MYKGFTIIEIIVVVIIIGILTAIAIPNFIRIRNRAKDAEVISNAHTVQLAFEKYSTTHDGNYPSETDLNDFINDYLPQNIKNPYGHAEAVVTNDNTPGEGEVSCDHDNYDSRGYTLYGAGKGGNIIVEFTSGQ